MTHIPLDLSAGIAGGWVCFCVSILIIGILTALIGDLATHVNIDFPIHFTFVALFPSIFQFGCTIGLTDTMTAIAFVALGTSLPGTHYHRLTSLPDRPVPPLFFRYICIEGRR